MSQDNHSKEILRKLKKTEVLTPNNGMSFENFQERRHQWNPPSLNSQLVFTNEITEETHVSKTIEVLTPNNGISFEKFQERRHQWNPPSLNSQLNFIPKLTRETQKAEAEQSILAEPMQPGSAS